MTEIQIIFENDDVVVINKPAGILVHEDGQSTEATVVDWLLARVPDARGVGEASTSPDGKILERSGVVHRLDRDTSGVMILAKTQASFEHLKAQFHDRLAEKEYHAFVFGRMQEAQGVIDRPIGRSAKDFRLRSAQRGARGTLREATTTWRVLDTGVVSGEAFSYVSLQPKTGRTHQIRVHMKAINRPIVGDDLYAGAQNKQSHILGISRLALHAHILHITLPCGEQATFTAPVPESFEKAQELVQAGE